MVGEFSSDYAVDLLGLVDLTILSSLVLLFAGM